MMLHRLIAIFTLIWASVLAGPMLAASQSATVIADRVELAENGNLIAQGHVEIFYDQTKMTAQKIVYDNRKDQIAIFGPLELRDAENNVISAGQATLSRDLQNGLLTSARIMMANQLELRAKTIERSQQGRILDLTTVAATSCQTCDGKPPLWQIRASEVKHDNDTHQIYMRNAQLRIWDVPVFYIPWLRVPDPSLDRSIGFLEPTLKSTTLLGTGLRVPYFIPIGDDKDITLTPYISAVTKTLETRYRQAFETGTVTVRMAASKDSLEPDFIRAHGKITGQFSLPQDYQLNFAIESVSDNGYLGDYYDDIRDQIASFVRISKTDDIAHREANLYHYRSLYDSNATLPTVISYNRYEKRIQTQWAARPITVVGEAHANYRTSSEQEIGRDMARLDGAVKYSDERTGWNGIRLGLDLQSRVDTFFIQQDDRYAGNITATTFDAMGQLRWPLMAKSQNHTWLIEPVVQLGYGHRSQQDWPNEESTRVEFDQGNLLALSRFPAPDRYEDGLRGAWGVNAQLREKNGYRYAVTLGQVFRQNSLAEFSQTSGLTGTVSDILLAAQIKTPFGLNIQARSLLDRELNARKTEILGQFSGKRTNIETGYSRLVADAQEERSDPVQEWTFASSWKLKNDWNFSNHFRYDIEAKDFATAGIGFGYDAQCANIAFSVSRRFTDLGSSPPQTSFNLSVQLKGFGTSRSTQTRTPVCRG